jgi:hypothetical protein
MQIAHGDLFVWTYRICGEKVCPTFRWRCHSNIGLGVEFSFPFGLMIGSDCVLGTRGVVLFSWVMPRTQHLPYARICPLPQSKRTWRIYSALTPVPRKVVQDLSTEYHDERVRIPRSTMLIDAARKHGDNRLVEGGRSMPETRKCALSCQRRCYRPSISESRVG